MKVSVADKCREDALVCLHKLLGVKFFGGGKTNISGRTKPAGQRERLTGPRKLKRNQISNIILELKTLILNDACTALIKYTLDS